MHLDPPRRWIAHRPGEHRPGPPSGRSRVGTSGPDQGYALRLADALRESVVLGPGEHIDDALAVSTQIALRRASRFGRAPVRADLEAALALMSYAAPLSEPAVERRRAVVSGSAHDLWRCQEFAASIADEVLGYGADEAAAHALDWTVPAAS